MYKVMDIRMNSQELLNIGIINSIELVSSSVRVTSAKFHKTAGGSDIERPGPKDRTPETPGSGKNKQIFKYLYSSAFQIKLTNMKRKSQ